MGYKIQGIPRQPYFRTYDCDSKLKYSKTRNVNLRLVGLPLAWTENLIDIPTIAGGYLFGVAESTYTYKKLLSSHQFYNSHQIMMMVNNKFGGFFKSRKFI